MRNLFAALASAALLMATACTSLPASYGVTPAAQSTLRAVPPPPLPPESELAAEPAPGAPASRAPTILLAQAGTPAFAEGTWQWRQTVFSDGKRVTPDAPDRYTVQFSPDGRFSVRADCNRGSSRFQQGPEAHQLQIAPPATTKMGCPEGSLGGEFLRQLGMVTGWLFANGELVLTFKFDSGSMLFRAQP
jgi:heat shock protein HslJ